MLKVVQAAQSKNVRARDEIAMVDVVAKGQMQDRTKLLLQEERKLKSLLKDFRVKEAAQGDGVTNNTGGGPL
jgi:hypothetical protein